MFSFTLDLSINTIGHSKSHYKITRAAEQKAPFRPCGAVLGTGGAAGGAPDLVGLTPLPAPDAGMQRCSDPSSSLPHLLPSSIFSWPTGTHPLTQ